MRVNAANSPHGFLLLKASPVTLVVMNITQFRLDLLQALYEDGRQETEDLARLVKADDLGLQVGDVKSALDGLLEANLVIWEAGGDVHLWRISPQGRDYLAAARGHG